MKKGVAFGVLAFAFVFCSAFVFADSVGPSINVTKVIPTSASVSVLFTPSDSDGVANCSLEVLPGLLKESSVVNSSRMNRLIVKNLSASTNYTLILSCADSLGNLASLEPLMFTTNETIKIIVNGTKPGNNSTSVSSDSSKVVLGISLGVVLLLVLVAIIFVVRKLKSKTK